MKKTFKTNSLFIGYIQVIIDKTITIKALDFKTRKKLYSKNFNIVFGGLVPNVGIEIDLYLKGLTTPYYADKILNYIISYFKKKFDDELMID